MSDQAQNPLNVVPADENPETQPNLLNRLKNFAARHKFATGVVSGAAVALGTLAVVNASTEEDENPEDPTAPTE
jgi:hypothetical protein